MQLKFDVVGGLSYDGVTCMGSILTSIVRWLLLIMLAGFSANILSLSRFFLFSFFLLHFDLVLSNHMAYDNQLWS